jgi:beta-galactosidase
MEFKITDTCFKLNNKNFFLRSAEMHYFRIEKKYWQEHIEKIKQAGCNTVCSYIPWDWHEESEGCFDFTGKTNSEKDLVSWLDLCKENGLYNIVKPGPYILAEYTGAGIPAWFIDKYKNECEVKNSQGSAGQNDVISFMHPVFLAYVKKWYDNILPIIKERQISNDGNILMMQVCNEVGVFTWLCKQADYSKHCIIMYREFLLNKYKNIENLNKIYKEEYKDFSLVEAPTDQGYEYNTKFDFVKDVDWHEFWRIYYVQYLRLLMNEIRERGVDLQFYHNLPGWIYGSAFEFPVNISMYNELNKDYPDIILGVDHIPENVSYRNMHDDMIINEMVLAQQNSRGPLFGAEFQAGSREYSVVSFPKELELFYKASIANGLKGWNYYMFSSGKNPKAKGYFSPTFYWFTPLNEKAEKSSLYPVVKKINNFINTFEQEIAETKKKSKICVLFYQKYYATELAKNITKEKCDIDFDPIKIRKTAYFDGILKVLQILNIDFDMLDIEVCTKDDMDKYEQIWMFSCDYMDENSQLKLADYAKTGGNLIVYPTLPKYNLVLEPCTILRDEIGCIKQEKLKILDAPKLQVFDNIDIAVLNPVVSYELNNDAEQVIKAPDGECAGFVCDCGQGRVFVLGTYFGFTIQEHQKAYLDIINKMGAGFKFADRTGERLVVKQRFNKEFSLLFVGNYFNEMEQDSIYYTHPVSGKKIQILLTGEKLNIPALYGFISPINKQLIDGVNLLHTTSDVLDIKIDKEVILITIQGDSTLQGEMAFEGNVKKILIDNNNLSIKNKDGFIYAHYEHTGSEQNIKLIIE